MVYTRTLYFLLNYTVKPKYLQKLTIRIVKVYRMHFEFEINLDPFLTLYMSAGISQ